MGVLAICIGVIVIFVVLWETFETIVLPRSVIRSIRLTRFFYVGFWSLYKQGVRVFRKGTPRESYLSAFGPMSLLLLITLWAIGLILGFALIQWGSGSHIVSSTALPGFGTDVYMSGATFFTLGYGDVTPATGLAKTVAVTEAGVGFGFLAIVIGYLPVIYASFSRREVGISLLDARAGSPPSAGEMLLRHARAKSMDTLTPLLATFENWASDLMESHLSYPVVAYYRSQHDRESWLSALTAVMDTCALVLLRFENAPDWNRPLSWQARMTFAMCRHAVVDLALVFNAAPMPLKADRLPPEDFGRLRALLEAEGLHLPPGPGTESRLLEIRAKYEPYVFGLAERMLMSLPPWLPDPASLDNWQSSAWGGDSHL